MPRLIVLAIALLAGAHAAAEQQCWEYRVTNAPYDAALTEATAEMAVKVNPFSRMPSVESPWDTSPDGAWLHRMHTDYLNEMGSDGWELVDVAPVSYANLNYFRRAKPCQ